MNWFYRYLCLLLWWQPAQAVTFISGEAFKSIATFVYKEENDNCRCYLPHPELVKCGDIIFLSRTFLEDFFIHCHPKIKHPYILISHHNDMGITEDYRKYLDDEKLFALFAQNVAITHPKVVPIPIGLRSACLHAQWTHEQHTTIAHMSAQRQEKKHLVYANFSPVTNMKVRKPLFDYLKTCDFCYVCEPRKTIRDYLTDVAQSKFVVSPHGSGLDCYRTWEALYLGAYPIVLTSPLDILYEGLPVLIVNNWRELSRELLEQKYAEFSNQQFNEEKLDFAYWHRLIQQYQSLCREKNCLTNS